MKPGTIKNSEGRHAMTVMAIGSIDLKSRKIDAIPVIGDYGRLQPIKRKILAKEVLGLSIADFLRIASIFALAKKLKNILRGIFLNFTTLTTLYPLTYLFYKER